MFRGRYMFSQGRIDYGSDPWGAAASVEAVPAASRTILKDKAYDRNFWSNRSVFYRIRTVHTGV
jgi:hypothetical protein